MLSPLHVLSIVAHRHGNHQGFRLRMLDWLRLCFDGAQACRLGHPLALLGRSRPSVIRMRSWLDGKAVMVLPRSPVGEGIAYARSNQVELPLYVGAPYLVIDNNDMQNTLRPVEVGRKNCLHPGSDRGGRSGDEGT